MINFMATHGRGLICAPLIEDRCEELELELMVGKNTAEYETPFTVSVDLIGHGCTTGISARDRAETIKALVNPNTRASELGKPGHIFPLKARKGGVLRRAGHTEAAIDLSRLAGLYPAGVIVEIMNEDGSIEKQIDVNLPTELGNFKLHAFRQITNDQTHLALVKGKWEKDEPILVRVHSSCITGDIFGSCRCDCGPQLEAAMQMVEKEGKGVIVYMNQEGRGIGLLNKLKAYKLQEQGRDTVEANEDLGFKADYRDYGVGAQILRSLDVHKIKLMSNNPKKRSGLIGYGLEIVENIAIEIASNEHNKFYLKTKRDKLGHRLSKLDEE